MEEKVTKSKDPPCGTAKAGTVMKPLSRRQRLIEKLLPPGTRRRYYYGLGRSGIRVISDEGWRSFLSKAGRWLKLKNSLLGADPFYQLWISQNEPSQEELARCREESLSLQYHPKISIITPVWNAGEKWLRSAIESVLNQVYDNWELCIADGGSTKNHVQEILTEYAQKEPRIKVKFLPENKGISGNSNEALSLATGEFVALLDHDDELASFALYEVVKLLNQDASPDFIYSDEDRINVKGKRYAPFFKPDWSPDLLHSYMYTLHFTVYRRSLVEECGRFRSIYDFSQDYDLALRASEKAGCIVHIPKVLYHWRSIPGSAAAGRKAFARASNIGALSSAVERRGYRGKAVIVNPPRGVNRIKFDLAEYPMVSIIIPTDNKKSINACIASVLETRYPQFELVIVTNSGLADALLKRYAKEPKVRAVMFDRPFNFSAKCNLGAACANGDYLLFLNDDVEVLSGDWLEEMVQLFQRPEVGAAAPKLVYRDNTIQHAGLVTGVRGLVGTAFGGWPRDSHDYFHFVQSTRNVSALSGACLMLPRHVLESIRGFDEINTPIMHSDVDLCFRIREKGYLLVYTPFATLRHIGHASWREVKPTKGATADLFLLKRWPTFTAYDPYYTENMRDLLYEDASYRYRLIAHEKGISEYNGKNILLVSHDLGLTGAPITLYNLAAYLASKGNFVTVVSPVEGTLAHRYREHGIPVMIDASIIENPLELTRRFIANYDMVLANTILSWRVVYAARESAVPVIWFIHEPDWGRELATRNRDIARALDTANVVLFPSYFTANLYKEFSSGKNFEVLYQGTDSPESNGTASPKPHDGFSVLHVGSIARRKGQDVLADSILRLPDEFSKMFAFYLVGRAVEGNYYAELDRAIGRLSNVHILGELERDELFEIYDMADVFVCTSRDEAFPLTIMEAMSRGKAIVASNVGGISEMIEHGYNGLLIPKEDPEALISSLIKLYEDKSLRTTLAQNAYERFRSSFSLDKYTERFAETLRKHGLL
jgi:glycosyltransferase involved in cell wall biosynthesis/GT2 family glycosyltransferase